MFLSQYRLCNNRLYSDKRCHGQVYTVAPCLLTLHEKETKEGETSPVKALLKGTECKRPKREKYSGKRSHYATFATFATSAVGVVVHLFCVFSSSTGRAVTSLACGVALSHKFKTWKTVTHISYKFGKNKMRGE